MRRKLQLSNFDKDEPISPGYVHLYQINVRVEHLE